MLTAPKGSQLYFTAFSITINHSCIDIYAHSCLKPFSIGLKAMCKQQNQCSNHEIQVLFEHGFGLKSADVIGQCDMKQNG